MNTQLYQKMFAEQEMYRCYLLEQTPEEILRHTYEYTVREDILMSLEYNDLSNAQCQALLKSSSPLDDVFHHFEKQESDYMDHIWECLQGRADMVLHMERTRRESAPER